MGVNWVTSILDNCVSGDGVGGRSETHEKDTTLNRPDKLNNDNRSMRLHLTTTIFNCILFNYPRGTISERNINTFLVGH